MLDKHEALKHRFSRQAAHYARLNTIQREVAAALLSRLTDCPKRILDLGAGCGAIFSQIEWPVEHFVAVDFAQRMCELHPVAQGVTVLQADFDSPAALAALERLGPFDLIISSSALQWAADLDVTLKAVARLGRRAAFALFTAGTFKSLHDYLGTNSPLPHAALASAAIARHFPVRTEVVSLRLCFDDRRSLFSYIRQSGVGGGVSRLTFGRARELLKNFPSLELEFEVLYAVTPV